MSARHQGTQRQPSTQEIELQLHRRLAGLTMLVEGCVAQAMITGITDAMLEEPSLVGTSMMVMLATAIAITWHSALRRVSVRRARLVATFAPLLGCALMIMAVRSSLQLHEECGMIWASSAFAAMSISLSALPFALSWRIGSTLHEHRARRAGAPATGMTHTGGTIRPISD